MTLAAKAGPLFSASRKCLPAAATANRTMLWRQTAPASHQGYSLAIGTILGDHLRLLLCTPGAAALSRPDKNLKLGLVQKLSVRHGSNLLDSAVGQSPI